MVRHVSGQKVTIQDNRGLLARIRCSCLGDQGVGISLHELRLRVTAALLRELSPFQPRPSHTFLAPTAWTIAGGLFKHRSGTRAQMVPWGQFKHPTSLFRWQSSWKL